MPPDDPITTPDDPAVDEPPQDPPALASVAVLPSEAIRTSPEYRELQRQNRELARRAGANERAATAARTEAERARQAAEAQQQTDLEAELAATLGEDGIVAYNEIAELSQSDPRAAARKMASLISQARAQSPVPAGEPAAPPAPAAGGQSVTTPAPPRGLGADAPLSQAPRSEGEDYEAIASDLEQNFNDVVARVQDPATRARTTMRDRAGAMISYIGASVLRSGARPSK